MAYTCDDLISSIKQRAMIPTSQSTWTSANFLTFIDEAMQEYMLDFVLSEREDYMLFRDEQSLVSGTTAYRMPYRAVGMSLRSLLRVDSSGNVLSQLSQIEQEDLDDSGDSNAYYIEGNKIILVEDPGSTGDKLRFTYHIRPNRAVLTTSARQITAINTSTRVVTLASSIPSGFTTSATYDLVRAKPGFDHLGIDLAVSAASGTSMTFSATLPTDLAVGDWVCLSEESPIPQIVPELHPLLAQKVACKVLESLGFADQMSAAMQVLATMEPKAKTLIATRVGSSPQTIVHRHSLFRTWRP